MLLNLLRYVDAYAAEGIPIFALTVQNEPDYEPKDYPGMRLNAPARARLIGDHLGPMIARRGSGPLIFDWDHNWDKPEEPMGVLSDPVAGNYVDAVAWHCYGGDVAAQSPVHDAFPDKDAYMTECSGGDWEPVRSGGLPLQAKNIIIRSMRHWARGALFWNLALDENNGPYAGGCHTCRGVVTIERDGAQFAACGPGDYVGEMSFLTGNMASATARTAKPVRLLTFDQAKLRQAARTDAGIRRVLEGSLNSNLVDKLVRSHGPVPEGEAAKA